ncbi:hypothetical protein FRC07_010618, partial [Ceratobasidium sp. 392]
MPLAKVENTLFKVHKYQLMKSETVSDMFKTAKGDLEEGSSSDKPIVLEGVAASDFECLMKMLYASYLPRDQPTPDASLIMPALRLAHKWNFEELYSGLLPIAEEELDDVDKVVVARECDIKEWLVNALTRLVRQRVAPFTTDEAIKLG